MSHTDYIEKPPEGFQITAHTSECPVAGMENVERKIYAVQFHPEVMHTLEGMKMLSNFVYDISIWSSCKNNSFWIYLLYFF